MTLRDELAGLTGEELYHLATELVRAEHLAQGALYQQESAGQVFIERMGLLDDIADARNEVLLQLARITIPLREAVAIIWRTRFARGRAVKMVPS